MIDNKSCPWCESYDLNITIKNKQQLRKCNDCGREWFYDEKGIEIKTGGYLVPKEITPIIKLFCTGGFSYLTQNEDYHIFGHEKFGEIRIPKTFVLERIENILKKLIED